MVGFANRRVNRIPAWFARRYVRLQARDNLRPVCATARNLPVHKPIFCIDRDEAGTRRTAKCAQRIGHFPTQWSQHEQ